MKSLYHIGFNKTIEEYIQENQLNEFSIGRIINQQKERYSVQTENGIFQAEITGNLRFTAQSMSDYPVVGDWVLLIDYGDMQLIHQIIPRKTLLERKKVSSKSDKQIIAANIDVAFIVQSLDNNFNINRLERYITMVYAGKLKPIIVLNKIDLVSNDELNENIQSIQKRIKDIDIIATKAIDMDGAKSLENVLQSGLTYCFIGSSGVGKSSLINNLKEKVIFETSEISEATQKGKHTTTHRELVLLDTGAILIDTPGMREFGVTDDEQAIALTFEEIRDLSSACRFEDCTHENEPGCAVLEALDVGQLDHEMYVNFKKLEREAQHFKSSVAEKRKKDKEFGKMVREVKKIKKNNKF